MPRKPRYLCVFAAAIVKSMYESAVSGMSTLPSITPTELSEAGTKTNGGLLGEVKRGDLSAKLESVAFELPAGQVSDPIEMPYGFHILMVEKRRVSERVPFDEAKDRIRKYLEDQKYQEALATFRKKIRAEAEWCVNEKYANRMPQGVKVTVCQGM